MTDRSQELVVLKCKDRTSYVTAEHKGLRRCDAVALLLQMEAARPGGYEFTVETIGSEPRPGIVPEPHVELVPPTPPAPGVPSDDIQF